MAIEVLRFNPEVDSEPAWHRYELPSTDRNTVLGALLQIREELDPTLAFRYGCRNARCGLCAMELDGKPALACRTFARDGMRVAPLGKLPVVRDLVIAREAFFQSLREHRVYLVDGLDTTLPVKETQAGARLRACIDCLGCLSTCSKYEFGDRSFAGPYLFVKLAQLHLDPRDRVDRRAQAKALGIEFCRSCDRKCYCLNGISTYRDAIEALLAE